MTVVAVGKSSFLAGAVRDKNPKDWLFLTHGEAVQNPYWLDTATCVVNFAYSPVLRTGEYNVAEDIDRKLAALIGNRPIRYIMPSSRLAYGPATGDSGLREGQEEKPATPYGRNKLASERALRESLGDRLTILRLGNIFGHEQGRKSFFGMSLSGLAENKTITFDMSPDQPRDFLSVWRVADSLISIAAKPAAGLFNLGSGFGTPCGKIAEWLIEGFGEGRLAVDDRGKDDRFWLDMSRTRTAFGLPVAGEQELRMDCISCGKKLKEG